MSEHDHTVKISLEFRCRPATRTRMFSPCPSSDAQPGAYTMALPGTLPSPNRQAIELALRLALAVGAAVAPISHWVREHDFDPRLPKGYRITQRESPLARGGAIEVDGRPLRFTRIVLSEDVGELHAGGVDLSRAGAPLIELISEPMRMGDGPASAAGYLRALATIVRDANICEDVVAADALRCAAHVSLCPKGQERGATRGSIDDVVSGVSLERAIAAEIQRQTALHERGPIVLHDDGTDREKTLVDEHGSYLPEPDLPPLRIDAATLERVRAELARCAASRSLGV
jgi:aspartyl-tRNA(Asn)/glutamyl-tRNA(Gln) amidotransferase subunit B